MEEIIFKDVDKIFTVDDGFIEIVWRFKTNVPEGTRKTKVLAVYPKFFTTIDDNYDGDIRDGHIHSGDVCDYE